MTTACSAHVRHPLPGGVEDQLLLRVNTQPQPLPHLQALSLVQSNHQVAAANCRARVEGRLDEGVDLLSEPFQPSHHHAEFALLRRLGR